MRGRVVELHRTCAAGVVIRICNVEELLPAALDFLERALSALRQWRVQLGVTVVLVTCADSSASIAREWRVRVTASRPYWKVHIVTSDATNAGAARARGCDVLLND